MPEIKKLPAKKVKEIKESVRKDFGADSMYEIHLTRALWEEEAKFNGMDYFEYYETVISGRGKKENIKRMREYKSEEYTASAKKR